MVSMTLASRYVTSGSRYKSRSLIYPRSDSAELAEADPIGVVMLVLSAFHAG